MCDVIGVVGALLVREPCVVEAESATTGGWNVVSRCASLEDATARLGHLSQRFAGVPVFDCQRWRLREVATGEVVPGESRPNPERRPRPTERSLPLRDDPLYCPPWVLAKDQSLGGIAMKSLRVVGVLVAVVATSSRPQER